MVNEETKQHSKRVNESSKSSELKVKSPEVIMQVSVIFLNMSIRANVYETDTLHSFLERVSKIKIRKFAFKLISFFMKTYFSINA